MSDKNKRGANRRFKDRKSSTPRNAFARDRDRVLYSDAFRRLSGVTQVARAGEASPFHTRLTHSLKVAQVGHRLAQYINREHSQKDINEEHCDYCNCVETKLVEPEVVATAGLAHDLGHPPFGHATESELDYQIREHGADDGFEGNPQSFRIVNRVETNALYLDHPEEKGRGLNLTTRSLNAVLKYPWHRGADVAEEYLPYPDYNTEEKFGYYLEEEDIFTDIRDNPNNHARSSEAELMDWADDVTYAVHDLVDFYRAGLIPLGELLQDTAEREEFVKHFEKEKGDKVTDEFDPWTFIEDLEQEFADPELQRKYIYTKTVDASENRRRRTDSLIDQMQSELIEEYLKVPGTIDVEFDNNTDQVTIQFNDKKEAQVEFLKELTFYYVIDNPALMGQQHGQRRMIATLFDAFLAATDEGYDSQFGEYGKYEMKMIPQPFRDDLKNARDRNTRSRYIADAITSMTEKQVVQIYERITGHVPGSLKEEIVR